LFLNQRVEAVGQFDAFAEGGVVFSDLAIASDTATFTSAHTIGQDRYRPVRELAGILTLTANKDRPLQERATRLCSRLR
jgi:hypothetical protein